MSEQTQRAFKPGQIGWRCRHGLHRYSCVPPNIRLVALKAGLRSEPNWYLGSTSPPYCVRCGRYADQEAARQLRRRVLAKLADIVPADHSQEGERREG